MSASLAPSPTYRVRATCRVCDAVLGLPYLDLGVQPFANGQRGDAPLAVVRCEDCGLSQLTVTVDPAVLYDPSYPFQSGTTSAWHVHAADLASKFGPQGFVIDVAANDGTQLGYFREKGWFSLGVDPMGGPPHIIQAFWSEKVAREIVHDFSTADLIIGQNVLGHVDDPRAFFRACEIALGPNGRVVIEVPHVGDLLDRVAFDTVYHEHLSYWSVGPIERAARAAGLVLVDVEHLSVHGGSRRYWFARWPNPMSSSVIAERAADARLADPETYWAATMRVEERLGLTMALLESVAGKRLWGYGASAKGAVMLNALKARGNDIWPTRIMDDTPAKAGTKVPGVGIKVVQPPESLALVDVLWILSWNWTDVLMRRARTAGFRGEFLLTHPEPRLL